MSDETDNTWLGRAFAALGKLVQLFGTTDTILIILAGLFISVVFGWIPSPMLNTITEIRQEQLRRQVTLSKVADRVFIETRVLRSICEHDLPPTDQKQCWVIDPPAPDATR